MSFKPGEREYCEGTAAADVAENLDLKGVIETYAALPEFAGDQVYEFLTGLPRSDNSKLDAFYALEIGRQTVMQIGELLKEDAHMKEMLAQAHQDDVNYKESLKGESQPGSRELDAYLKQFSGGAQDAIDRAMREEGLASDDKISNSFLEGLRGDQARSRKTFNYSNLSPAHCFRRSTHDLGKGIEWMMCGGPKGTPYRPIRMLPLIEHQVISLKEIQVIMRSIGNMIHKLRVPDDADQEQDY